MGNVAEPSSDDNGADNGGSHHPATTPGSRSDRGRSHCCFQPVKHLARLTGCHTVVSGIAVQSAMKLHLLAKERAIRGILRQMPEVLRCFAVGKFAVKQMM